MEKFSLTAKRSEASSWKRVTESRAKEEKNSPNWGENASEREKARHAYTVFVFKRDKDIPSVLTPSEVAVRLDEKGENAEIFTNYNFARYSEEKF